MQVRLALIRQHIEQAQKQAKELSVICEQAKDDAKTNRAFEIEMGLEWTDRKAKDFQAILPTP
jgi:hypothetical protein